MVNKPVKDREPVRGSTFSGHVGKLAWMTSVITLWRALCFSAVKSGKIMKKEQKSELERFYKLSTGEEPTSPVIADALKKVSKNTSLVNELQSLENDAGDLISQIDKSQTTPKKIEDITDKEVWLWMLFDEFKLGKLYIASILIFSSFGFLVSGFTGMALSVFIISIIKKKGRKIHKKTKIFFYSL
jgi:hypothetical protein